LKSIISNIKSKKEIRTKRSYLPESYSEVLTMVDNDIIINISNVAYLHPRPLRFESASCVIHLQHYCQSHIKALGTKEKIHCKIRAPKNAPAGFDLRKLNIWIVNIW